MAQTMQCSSCKKHCESVYNEKTKSYYKSCFECRKKKSSRKKHVSKKTDNEEEGETLSSDNVSTKSSTQQSQTSLLNSLHIIANSTNTTKFYNIDDEEQELRKPTINEKLDHMNMSLEQVKNTMANHPMGQTSNDDDIELLKARIDNIELMLQNQNKLISDIESNIKHCIYQIYCKL
jgi:hypothetical protein